MPSLEVIRHLESRGDMLNKYRSRRHSLSENKQDERAGKCWEAALKSASDSGSGDGATTGSVSSSRTAWQWEAELERQRRLLRCGVWWMEAQEAACTVPTGAEVPLGNGRAWGAEKPGARGQVFAKRRAWLEPWRWRVTQSGVGGGCSRETSASQLGGCKEYAAPAGRREAGPRTRTQRASQGACRLPSDGPLGEGEAGRGLAQGQGNRASCVDGQMVCSKMGRTAMLAQRVYLGPWLISSGREA